MPAIMTATAADLQNDFGHYLKLVIDGNEIIVTKNGKDVGRFIPAEESLTDSLTGILKKNVSLDEERKAALEEKYAHID